MHLHFEILEQIGKNFEHEEKAYLYLYLKVWYICARKIGPATYIMSRNGFTDAERAQCVIWMTEGYGATAVERLFRDEYGETPPDRSTIRL